MRQTVSDILDEFMMATALDAGTAGVVTEERDKPAAAVAVVGVSAEIAVTTEAVKTAVGALRRRDWERVDSTSSRNWSRPRLSRCFTKSCLKPSASATAATDWSSR